MPLCPNQHESRTTDFCEVCGVEMTPPAADAPPGEPPSVGDRTVCPACHAEHDAGTGDFCEVCGYNFKTGVHPVVSPPPPRPVETVTPFPPPPPVPLLLPGWELVVAVAPNPHVGMPDDAPPPARAEEVCPLAADTLLIGRRSLRRQIHPDLSLDHDDGVSHRHARLTRLPGGEFSLEDFGSSNGTTVNGTEVKPGFPVVLKAGDRIALGRWTSLTLRRKETPADEAVSPSPNPPTP